MQGERERERATDSVVGTGGAREDKAMRMTPCSLSCSELGSWWHQPLQWRRLQDEEKGLGMKSRFSLLGALRLRLL